MNTLSSDLKLLAHKILNQGISMIGIQRMENILECTKNIIHNQVPGDFVETGVWRGGACIFMRAILKEYHENNRRVFVCDSYEGLPPDEKINDLIHKKVTDKARSDWNNLSISLEEVQNHFMKYNVLDDQVVFVKGWFKDTLPGLQTDKVALLRLDGDMYSSTMDALNNLYHKVSVGGFVIVDDYGHFPQCKEAVDEFRVIHNIQDEIKWIDYTGVYWQKN